MQILNCDRNRTDKQTCQSNENESHGSDRSRVSDHTTQYKSILATASMAMCCFLSACQTNDTHIESPNYDRVTKAAVNSEKGEQGIPGLDIVPLLDNMKLRDTIQKHVDRNSSEIIVINNDSLSQDYDISDALSPLAEPQAIRSVRLLRLYHFPFNDKEIEPIEPLHVVDLSIKRAHLMDLHALKSMNSVKSLCVAGNPLNSKAVLVLSHLPNLRKLDLSNTPLTEPDIRTIMHNSTINDLLLIGCKNIDKSAIARLRKQYPKCCIRDRNPPGAKGAETILLKEADF